MISDNDKSQHFQFYGRRHGHTLKPARRKLVDTLLNDLRVPLPTESGILDVAGMFGETKKEYWMEIGFGGGEHLAALAEKYPDIGFIGCEPYVNGVASLLSHVHKRSLSNIRIYDDDARHLLPSLPDDVFERLYLLYADPWPKKRHNRRRFIQPDTLNHFARLIKDGGEFRFASDYMDYIRWTLAHVMAAPDFDWMAGDSEDWRTRPQDSIETRYEAKARKAGARCVYLSFKRCART